MIYKATLQYICHNLHYNHSAHLSENYTVNFKISSSFCDYPLEKNPKLYF